MYSESIRSCEVDHTRMALIAIEANKRMIRAPEHTGQLGLTSSSNNTQGSEGHADGTYAAMETVV